MVPTQHPTRRRRNPLRDYTVVLWLTAAAVVALVHRWVPSATWLMVHLVVLGALSHSILVWSRHFANALLKTRPLPNQDRHQSLRLLLFLLGSAAVFVAVPAALWPLAVAGGTVLAAVVVWHGVSLFRQLRRALPLRFRITIHYYLAAAAWLPVGVTFGVLLARGLSEQWHARLLVAHTLTMILGWVGMTLVGTLITFWPTVLRARMDDRAERAARQVFLPLNLAVLAVVGAAVAGWTTTAVLALAVHLALVLWWGRTLIAPFRARPPQEFAPASIGAAMIWFVLATGLTGVLVLTSDSGSIVRDYPGLAAYWVGGFMLQLLTGALSYLLPSVLGGGPRVVRAAGQWFDRWASLRLTVINGALLLWMLPTPTWVRVGLSAAAMLAFLVFIPLMIGGIRAAVAERRAMAAERAGTAPGAPAVPAATVSGAPAVPAAAPGNPAPRLGVPLIPKTLTATGVLAGLTALALIVAVGVAVGQSLAAPARPAASTAVVPTGRTLEVAVEAADMRFTPSVVEAQAGDRVVLTVHNTDASAVHDLSIAGQTTPRLSPGQSAVLDLGVVGESAEGWCTIVGHHQQGMVFSLHVTGQEGTTAADGADGQGGHGEHSAAGVQAAPGRTVFDPTVALTRSVDATAPPTPQGVDHRFTLRASEMDVEVAPGVWQKRWPYSGGAPENADGQNAEGRNDDGAAQDGPPGSPDPAGAMGPTIRGKVGDTFEVTFVNDSAMEHSIDFHASEVAPNTVMRTIAPGEQLVYRFTARRAGIWMYHCGAAPMTSHISAGMFGAVMIDPPGLEPVDREYVIVQSEVYVQPGTGASQEEAAEVDAARAAAGDPDMVVFNGIADQYRQHPLQAVAGERVRFWVLAAGPNHGSNFHIVGTQFDTVYAEGAYQLKDGRDAFGTASGGSQVLGLAAAQGGFVETVFPEAGRYPMVDHSMMQAERGARGLVEVTD
ncbi:multicopper oxidase domain-containing protein [Micrococcus sp.]|uniref:multicopper oxidase domain-containing protein n=1 Tax=Micrococcus sp. TaxID=1271 RepID=UPI002A91B3DD|nr:multicopper oxidase domain-containing protein [Micrococcus sp.]MDY6054274.1 multicopper oxidase domain-containing protein [Micrococcus sp.]